MSERLFQPPSGCGMPRVVFPGPYANRPIGCCPAQNENQCRERKCFAILQVRKFRKKHGFACARQVEMNMKKMKKENENIYKTLSPNPN